MEKNMYKSFITNETFENEHDEKMTRKFSYNYQVLKRLFPEVYKLPESEIRSLVHSIYDNPKMGDELLDHLSDVINKKKPEWGEYLNPKPEDPEQTVQDNPLQPVQPKPLNTSSGFEPYKPQKSAFGLGNSGGFGNAGGLGNTSAFGFNNTNNFGTIGGLKQSQLPNFTKGMDLKHSDMVTGFGINEAKQNSMLGTGFSMPKLPQFPKAPEPQTPDFQSAQQLNNARLQNYYNRPFTSYIPWGEVGQAAKDGITSGLEQVVNGATLGAYNYLDRHSDNAAAERYNRLQNDAYQAGIGNWYDRVQMANKAAGKYITRNLLKKHLF